jgi:drug/metabolite transporter (DMT)-like permease
MGTLVPYLLVTSAIKNMAASTASIIGMLEPIFAGAFAWVLLKETFTAIQLAGAGVVLVGIYLADRASSSAH